MTTAEMRSRAKTRILSVEILRVVAMLGIAIFHTFKPWFEQLVTGDIGYSYLPIEPQALRPLIHPIPLATLGFIDQLGAWGNHVFIMISGYFLLPRAIKLLTSEGGDVRQSKQIARRAKHILFTVGLYSLCALVIAFIYPDATSVSLERTTWVTQGLQFIWVYLALVILCPLIARVWSGSHNPELLLATAAVPIYAVNIFIAFISPGSVNRTLFEWRKMMSAVTYGLSFVIGGWIAMRCRKDHYVGKRTTLSIALLPVAITIALEAYASLTGNLSLLDSLSFKSTSPLACVMAVSSLTLAVLLTSELGTRHPRLSELISLSTSGMLGFYVLQSLLSQGWHAISNTLLARALSQGVLAFFATGLAFSAVLFVVFVTIDSFMRQPLLARLQL